MPPISVLHLVGSVVDDFHAELSRLYAGACLDALADSATYDVHLAYVSPDGSWRFPTGLDDRALTNACPLSTAEAVTYLTTLDLDLVVPQMFCVPGMTTYRALLDVLGLPYLGNRPDVMAIAADKAKARAIVSSAGAAVPEKAGTAAGGAGPRIDQTARRSVLRGRAPGSYAARQANATAPAPSCATGGRPTAARSVGSAARAPGWPVFDPPGWWR